MSNLKMIELAIYLALPIWAFFDKRHSTSIWKLWLVVTVLIILSYAIVG